MFTARPLEISRLFTPPTFSLTTSSHSPFSLPFKTVVELSTSLRDPISASPPKLIQATSISRRVSKVNWDLNRGIRWELVRLCWCMDGRSLCRYSSRGRCNSDLIVGYTKAKASRSMHIIPVSVFLHDVPPLVFDLPCFKRCGQIIDLG